MTRQAALDVRVSDACVDEYRKAIDRTVDAAGARAALVAMVKDRVRVGIPGEVTEARDGAEVWRCGQDRLYVHVFDRGKGGLDVVWVRPPHAMWKPRTMPAMVRRHAHGPQDALGSILRAQRERMGLTIEQLASLAGVRAEALREPEGNGELVRAIGAVSEVLGVDVRVVRRAKV